MSLVGNAFLPPAVSQMTIEYMHEVLGSFLPRSVRIFLTHAMARACPFIPVGGDPRRWGESPIEDSQGRPGTSEQSGAQFNPMVTRFDYICLVVAGGVVGGRHSTATHGEGSALLNLQVCIYEANWLHVRVCVPQYVLHVCLPSLTAL